MSLGPEIFTAAANASVVTAIPGATLDNYPADKTQFNPYAYEDHFYLAAFIFEDVGVTAYKGAIANLQVGWSLLNCLPLQSCLYFVEKPATAPDSAKFTLYDADSADPSLCISSSRHHGIGGRPFSHHPRRGKIRLHSTQSCSSSEV